VILRLEHTPEDVMACPIGQAAHVEFPGIGVFDVLRARLGI
jgi:hypothetical protein